MLEHDSSQLFDQRDPRPEAWPFDLYSDDSSQTLIGSTQVAPALFALRKSLHTGAMGSSAYLIEGKTPANQPVDAHPIAARPEYRMKRVTDVIGAVALLVLFAPLMVLVALAILTFQGAPVLYHQERLGLNGKTFRIFKFRTMRVNADTALKATLAQDAALSHEWSTCQKMACDPRVTRLGKLLRLSSVDELPQLFNVIRGEMSLVGPRPIVAEEAARYGRYFAPFASVRPGLTGLWQVSGRNATTYRRRVALDVCYSRRQSLALDLKILLKTIPAVLAAQGR